MSDYVCAITPEGWQLYTVDRDCTAAAEAINRAVTKEVRAALERFKADPCLSERKLAAAARDAIYETMNEFAEYGACDTEPECVLVEELERAFGLDPYTLDRM